MTGFCVLVVWNAVLATVLAGAVALSGCLKAVRHRPGLQRTLWMLVLLKLITPPLIPVPILPSHPVQSSVTLSDDLRDSPLSRPRQPLVDGRQGQSASLYDDAETVTPRAWSAHLIDATRKVDRVSWLVLLLCVSVSGTLTLLGWNVVQTFRVSGLLRRANPGDRRLEGIVRQAASRIGTRIAPEIRVVDARMTPLLWARWHRPAVVVPRGLVDRLDDEQMSCIVRHELAHYVRCDHWANACGLAVAALFWWHPVAWWARREMQVAQELCCDALALDGSAATRRRYAETLFQTLEFIQTERSVVTVLGVGFGPRYSIRRRFEMIANASFNDRRSWWTHATILTVAVMLPCLPVRGASPPDAAEPPGTGLVSPSSASGSAIQHQTSGQESTETTRPRGVRWAIAMSLDTPNLEPPAVQFAVFDKDPVSGYESWIKMMRTHVRTELEASVAKESRRSELMSFGWDYGFKEVTGNEVALLTSTGPHRSATVGAAALNGSKKWIVTKITYIDKKPVCWCIPFTVKKGGKMIPVTLTEDNLFELGPTFDEALRQAERD
ncbi:MAG: M56 family metallopeptidase [Planctomycetes bacterium]|nr:M56 family metallopeptidase [Planctomycetota bacterium]MBL7039474.1 M56 family metallopeptidase [Pirellulaceae bacterium]